MTTASKAGCFVLFAVATLGFASMARADVMPATALPAPAPIPNTLAAPPLAMPGSLATIAVLPAGEAVAFEPAGSQPRQNTILPEPATIAVLGIGLMGLGFLRRSRAR